MRRTRKWVVMISRFKFSFLFSPKGKSSPREEFRSSGTKEKDSASWRSEWSKSIHAEKGRRYNDLGNESATRRCLGWGGGKGKSETSSLETGALLANRKAPPRGKRDAATWWTEVVDRRGREREKWCSSARNQPTFFRPLAPRVHRECSNVCIARRARFRTSSARTSYGHFVAVYFGKFPVSTYTILASCLLSRSRQWFRLNGLGDAGNLGILATISRFWRG